MMARAESTLQSCTGLAAAMQKERRQHALPCKRSRRAEGAATLLPVCLPCAPVVVLTRMSGEAKSRCTLRARALSCAGHGTATLLGG